MAFVVSRKVGELATVDGGGPVTWYSRQPTAAGALEEASAIMGVPESQLVATPEGSIDWGDGNVIEMKIDGDFA